MLAAAQRFQQGGEACSEAGWRSGTAAQSGPKTVCSGSALTQEGNTPFMEAPRVLSPVPVRVHEVGEGPQLTTLLLVQLSLSGSEFSRPDGKWERRSRAPAEPRLRVGSWVPVCTPLLTLYVTSGKSLISLSLSFPISLAGTESCEKELRCWRLEWEGGHQGHR